MTDLHTRKLRYFIAVAEELHFSRAAARLFVAQQALSRQVRELEEELGVPLLLRTTRKVELTAAGQVFLDGARAALDALDSATAMAVRTNRAVTGTLRLGFFPGAALELTEPILSEFRLRFPEVVLEMREFPVVEPGCGLLGGTSDLALIRLPIDDSELAIEPLFSEPLMVAMSPRHRLAGRAEVTVSELLDEPITLSRGVDPVFCAFWVLEDFRAGCPAPRIVTTSSVTEEAQLVSNGSAIAITAAAAARYVVHPGLTYVPIVDAPRSTVALAWRRSDDAPLIARFREAALAVLDNETETLSRIENPLTPR